MTLNIHSPSHLSSSFNHQNHNQLIITRGTAELFGAQRKKSKNEIMLKIITTLTLFLIGILAKGQEVEMRTVSSFSKVKVQHGIELVYTENAATSVRIEAPNQSIMENISTTVKGHTLTIDLLNDKDFTANRGTIRVYLATNNLVALEANTNAIVTLEDELTSKNLTINLDSGASFTGNIKVSKNTNLIASDNSSFNGKILSSSLNGNFTKNAKINVTGKANRAAFETSNTVLLSARNFVSSAINVKASGNSVATIYANSNLTVDVADEAKITYTGFPDNIALNEDAVALQKYRSDQLLTLN